MEEEKSSGNGEGEVKRATSWETYKLLNKIKETVHQKRKMANDIAAQQSIDTHGNQITIEKRLSMTQEQLNDLLCDGKELITNIKLANERRETKRRTNEDHRRAQLMANLQHESDEATNKLNAINGRWAEMNEIADPMDLNERLCYQNERIGNLMAQKSAIIADLQDALSMASQTYNIAQVTHQGDIQCLIERIDEQIEVMKSVYLEHLELLHQSIDSERRTFKLYHSQQWQNLYDEQSEDGEQMVTDLLAQQERNYDEIASIRLQHEEINRKMRIKLDRDNDLVQQKLQRVKAEINLNTDQLNYNYYVLQKRAAENIIVRNKQKNRLIKMRTCIAILRKRINEAKIEQTIEVERQTHYVLNLYANIRELERKMCTFSENDDRKFQQVWQLHEMSADSKLENIMMIDKMLHEKHLGLLWQTFQSKPCRRQRPLKQLSDGQSNQSQSNQPSMNATKLQYLDRLQTTKTNAQHSNFSDLFYAIAEQIASQQNWMLGDAFTDILDLIDDDEHKQIVIIDHILSALGVDNLENAYLLKEYFLSYASCIYCSKKYADLNIMSISSNDGAGTVNSNVVGKCPGHKHHVFGNFFIEKHMIPTIMQQFLIDMGIRTTITSSSSPPQTVAKPSELDRLDDDGYTVDVNEIEGFWNDYTAIIPNDMELIWDTIDNGLIRYLQILKKRKQLSDECIFLRQQNAEITHLLQQYAKDDLLKYTNN